MEAKRVKFKLPSLKLSQRSTSGEQIHRIVPRGCVLASQHDTEKAMEEEDNDNVGSESGFDGGSFNDITPVPPANEPSLHEITQKASIASWSRMRLDLLRTVIESNCMPHDQYCSKCFSQQATYRCLQCGPKSYFCHNCFGEVHNTMNFFHTGEAWDSENGVYRPVTMKRTIDIRKKCLCSSVNFIPLCCISEYGEEYSILFASCTCEPLVVTMIRARLWPSTPQRPQLAFTFELMDWAEALLLECQVSLRDFSKALLFKCHHLVMKQRDVYSALIDSFEEYRWMKVELRQLTSLCPELDRGNVCPACPKESGGRILSIDALFGLPRKKAAGVSHRDSLHGDIFFGDQVSVDEHVLSSEACGKTTKVQLCNNFLAGDSLRSSGRYHALDETALFGCACRHEFPHLFINLRHGERLSYAVWLLEELSQRTPSDISLFIMYDVACNLVRHLKASRNGNFILDRMKFALPSFHAYGHNAACQIVYSPLRCNGIGLSDGEVMERMWSYLRRYARMTKEMRPAHRIDILTHALVYYGSVSKKKLPMLLSN